MTPRVPGHSLMNSFLPRLLALTVLGVTVPALLSGQTVRTRDASGREITRKCQPAISRKELPAVGAVIDSAVVVRQLAKLPPGDAARWLLSLSVAKNDTTPTVRWVEPETGPDTVLQILSGAVRSRKSGAARAVRLRLELRSSGSIALEPAIYCPPRPNSLALEAVQRVEIWPRDRLLALGKRIRIVAEVLVLETGAVADIRLLRASGIPEVDDGVRQHLRRTHFLPALLEGMPVAGRYWTDWTSPRP